MYYTQNITYSYMFSVAALGRKCSIFGHKSFVQCYKTHSIKSVKQKNWI